MSRGRRVHRTERDGDGAWYGAPEGLDWVRRAAGDRRKPTGLALGAARRDSREGSDRPLRSSRAYGSR